MPALPTTCVQRKKNKALHCGQARARPCRDVVTRVDAPGERHASWPEEKGDSFPPLWGAGEVDWYKSPLFFSKNKKIPPLKEGHHRRRNLASVE